MGDVSRRPERAVCGRESGSPCGAQGYRPRPSEEPLDLSAEELAGIHQPTLIVSSEDSPEVLRRVDDRLAAALPRTEQALVNGGHLIHPAHPAVLDFVGRILAPPS